VSVSNLAIATFNIKNVRSNVSYLQSLMKSHDLIAIQEHWLFQFEKNFFEEINPQFFAISRHVDDDNPIQPSHKPRGFGGVAWLWNKDMDSIITPLEGGGKRTLAIQVETSGRPLCLITVYMPSRGGPESESQFKALLDELHETYEKYTPTHSVFLMGDINASLAKDTPCARDRHLASFCRALRLHTSQDLHRPTFLHENGKDTSVIDYILLNESHKSCSHEVKTHSMALLNNSDHVPLSFILQEQVSIQHSAPSTSSNLPTWNKVNWAKCDLATYEDWVAIGLKTMEVGETEFDMEWATIHISDILHRAAMEAEGKEKPSKPSKKHSKKGLTIWNKNIAEAVKIGKSALTKWRRAGKPRTAENPLVIGRKAAKKNIKRQIAIATWSITDKLHKDISSAHKHDSKLFHKLINRQRKGIGSLTSELIVNGECLADPDSISEGFRSHFASLAEPSENPKFDEQHRQLVHMDNLMIKDICKRQDKPITPTSEEEVGQIIAKLNTGKAPDNCGITAEHLKYAGKSLLPTITKIMNTILRTKIVPRTMKEGVLTPIEKKGKDKTKADGYRGITVLSVLEKTLENIFTSRLNKIVDPSQNPMQRGFTANCGSNNAALLVSEALNDCKDEKKTLFLTTLDATKAFDVVSHESLFRKLYLDGVEGDMLLMLQEIYRDPETKVKWKGQLSTPFQIHQGVRQGSPLSTTLYKRYNNRLLDELQHSGYGFAWGSIPCPAPTCADDVAILSSNAGDQQALIDQVDMYSKRERYQINANKSATISYIPSRAASKQLLEGEDIFFLDGKEIPVMDVTTHLGVQRDNTNSSQSTIENNLGLSRRTLYALMGSGLHGENGLHPSMSVKILETYVTPRCVFGLEVLHLNKAQQKEVDIFHKRTLRQLQSLPEKPPPSDIAIYALVGQIPLSAVVEKQALMLFGSLSRQKDSMEYDLARRQLSLKPEGSSSWFLQVHAILRKYDLPSSYEILQDAPTKDQWKTLVKKKFAEFWENHWRTEQKNKPSLKYLNIQQCKVGHLHSVWDSSTCNKRDIRRAGIKARLLTGTYTLEANRAVYNQHEVKGICTMCNAGMETREHFLATCTVLEDTRSHYLHQIQKLLQDNGEDLTRIAPLLSNANWLTQLILDCSHPLIQNELHLEKSQAARMELESITRNLCFALHIARSNIVFAE
jgi:endonuclease/exonuclease/phosphatase family metal-dependent hydrolase